MGKSKNAKKPVITYPRWRVFGSPTPAQSLWVCDKCNHAYWVAAVSFTAGDSGVKYCDTWKCATRMRRATQAEKAEGEKHLQVDLGNPHKQ